MIKKKWVYRFSAIIILVVMFVISPLFQFAKAALVMSVYSSSEKKASFLNEAGIDIRMSGGLSTVEKDYFPFVMTFNDSAGFSNYINRDVDLTILYNFGAFDYMAGSSLYYQQESDYFDAFYGAYAVRGKSDVYGYSEKDGIDFQELARISEYDMNELVLKSIGCKDPIFDFQIDRTYEVQDYVGWSGWQVIDGTITTNSPMHSFEQDYMAYIQYGRPPKPDGVLLDFETVQVKGRVYAKYFEEQDTVICLYIIAPDMDAVDKTDAQLLQKTKIEL